METKKTLEEVRKIFEADRFATENGAVIEEIGEHSAICSLDITESHCNAMGLLWVAHTLCWQISLLLLQQTGKNGMCIIKI